MSKLLVISLLLFVLFIPGATANSVYQETMYQNGIYYMRLHNDTHYRVYCYINQYDFWIKPKSWSRWYPIGDGHYEWGCY